jgi:hypothetical protein
MTYVYTARDTHQHNNLAELGFASSGNKGRVIIIRADIPLKSRYLLFRGVFKTANDLDYLVITSMGTKKATMHERFYGSNPKWMKFLRTWGGSKSKN